MWRACILFPLVLALAGSQPAIRHEAIQKDCPSYFSRALHKTVYRSGDTEPDFPGGPSAYTRFLGKHLRVPEEVMEDGSTSIPRVNMKFVVDDDGMLKCISLNDKKDTSSFGPMEKEAYRLIGLMPKWDPGTCKGKKVPMEVEKLLAACILVEHE
ncbi:MAG: hypothetical protein J7578_06055 [Chitinophagaceae bacterium]|nr:hypothetical protein [Chitinophagaceae bacterium]